MKKLFTVILISFFLTLGACAENNGEIVGTLFATDIKASIDTIPISGYNIGGKTAILLEDLLDGYGFTVLYDDSTRTITANTLFEATAENRNRQIESSGVSGNMIGNIYATDIQAVVNGYIVPSYNIGGKTAVCMEDLGNIADSVNEAYGYSYYYMNAVWDGVQRSITLNTLRSNRTDAISITAGMKMSYNYHDGVITFSNDPFGRIGFGGEYGDHFNRMVPLKTVINGKESEKTFIYLFADNYFWVDLAVLKTELEKAEPISSTYEEVLKNYTDDEFWYTTKIDIPTGVVLWRSSKGQTRTSDALIRINLDGSYQFLGSELAVPNYTKYGITMVQYNKDGNSLAVTRRNPETDNVETYRITLSDNRAVLVG
jgi:hypothetical protein